MLQSLILYLHLMAFVPSQTTTLQTAMDQNLVSVSVTANPRGTHYQNPMIISLTNLTQTSQKIVIENGRTFLSNNPDYQPIVTAVATVVEIEPGETKETYVQGFCFSQHLKTPSVAVDYCVGDMATGNLAKICNFIQQYKLQGLGAQYAVWCITDSRKLDGIVDWDKTKQKALIEYVADIMGGTAPELPDRNNYASNLSMAPATSFDGNFTCNLTNVSQVNIGLFDKNGVIVRELYFNATEQPGEHTISYAFDPTVYTDDLYFVKLLQDNQVIDEQKVEL